MRKNMSGNLGVYKYLWPGSVDIVYSYTSPLLEGSGGIDPNILAIV